MTAAEQDLAREWESVVAGLLAAVRQTHGTQAHQMRDAGADPWEYVAAEIAERLLPCPVTVRLGSDATVIQLTLSGEPSSFMFDASAAAATLRGPDDEGTLVVSDPSTLTTTIYAESPAWLLEHSHAIELHLRSVFDAMAIEEEDRLLAEREKEYEQIGYHELLVRPASGDPDPRWQLLSKFAAEGPRGLRQGDLLAHLPATRTLRVVPDDIDSIVESARVLLIHGWEQWEFFSLAEQQSIVALESSGRRLAIESDRQEGGDAELKKILRSNPALVSWLESTGLLTPWEARHARNLFELRNELIHGQFAQTHLDSWATDIVIRSVRLVNAMWLRHTRKT